MYQNMFSLWDVSMLSPPILWLFVQSTRTQRFLKTILTLSCWIGLAENSQISPHMPGFQSFFSFLRHFGIGQINTSSTFRVKMSAG